MATWGFGGMVLPGSTKEDRYLDWIANNPSITPDTTGACEQARDQAFQYIEHGGIIPPYRIIANGEIVDNEGGFTFSVQVVVPPPPEE
jgi:hypothetical protein